MAPPVLTSHQLARIWIKATAPGLPDPAAKLLCAINAKALNQSTNLSDTVVADCDDPLLVSYVKRTPTSKDWSITGTGAFELDLRNDLQNIIDSAVSTDIVFEYVDPAAPDGYYSGKAFLATFNQIANAADGYINIDLDFQGDGPLMWTAGP